MISWVLSLEEMLLVSSQKQILQLMYVRCFFYMLKDEDFAKHVTFTIYCDSGLPFLQ